MAPISPALAWWLRRKKQSRKFVPPNPPPAGFKYVVVDGKYVQDANGQYVLEPA